MLYKWRPSDRVIIVEAEHSSKVPEIQIVVADAQVWMKGFWKNENLINR